jgi:hypothetical protein
VPARKTDRTSKPASRQGKRTGALGKSATPLPKSMVTGKASSAKAAVVDKPVFAYIAGLPQPQRGIAERVDALAAKTLPGRRPRQAHVHKRRGAQSGAPGDAGGNGQGYAGRGAQILGRPRRAPDHGMDAASRDRSRCREERAVGPTAGCKREDQVEQGWTGRLRKRGPNRIGIRVQPNPGMRPTGRKGPGRRAGAALLVARQWKS